MEPSRRPGVVFDCNVFLQALANERSAAAKALDLLEQDAITLFVSEPILREVRDVLTRTKIRRKLPRITNVRVRALLQRLIARAILIKNIPEEFKYQRDPKDEMYINLAIVANDPSRIAELMDELLRLARALDRLSARQRAVFTLRHYQDLSLEEISVTLDLDVGTVKAHMFRAVSKLREELRDLYGGLR